jgi:hypothetical protein
VHQGSLAGRLQGDRRAIRLRALDRARRGRERHDGEAVDHAGREAIAAHDPGDARVTVDGTAYDAPTAVAAGTHHVVAARAGYAETRRDATGHDGTPINLEVALVALVSVRLSPAGATLVLDGKPLAVQDGGAAIPPGSHVVVARAPGFREQRIEIPVERAADYQLAIELVPDRAPRAPAAHSGPMASLREFGIGMVEGSAALLGVGFITAVKAQSTPDDQRIADVLLVTGGVAAVAGAILWVTAPDQRRPQAARIVPTLGTDRVGFVVAGSF